MATEAQRTHLAALMDWLVRHEPAIHYKQVRPMKTAKLREQPLVDSFGIGHTITMDCSEAVTLLCRLAGLGDPNDAGYNGTGNTGTMLARLPHYRNPSAAGIGALVVFGPGTAQVRGDHVCMVRHPGPDPVLWSHGQERGPFYIHLSDEARAHRPPVTFLSIARL